MKFHDIPGLPCASLFGGKATFDDCRGMWGDCTVIVCQNQNGTLFASVSCGDTGDEVTAGDMVEMIHTQTGRTNRLGKVLAVFRPGMKPKAEDADRKLRVWVWK